MSESVDTAGHDGQMDDAGVSLEHVVPRVEMTEPPSGETAPAEVIVPQVEAEVAPVVALVDAPAEAQAEPATPTEAPVTSEPAPEPVVPEPVPAEEPAPEPVVPEPVPAEAPAAEAEVPTEPAVEAIVEAAPESVPVVAATAEAEPQPEPAGEPAAVPAVEPAGEAAAVIAVEVAKNPNAVSIWPFVAYVVLWVAYAATLVWRLSLLPTNQAAFESEPYRFVLLAGLVLLVAGPILTLVTWFSAWGRAGSTKTGLFLSAFMRGAASMFIGTCLWWIALLVLDQLRLGRFL